MHAGREPWTVSRLAQVSRVSEYRIRSLTTAGYLDEHRYGPSEAVVARAAYFTSRITMLGELRPNNARQRLRAWEGRALAFLRRTDMEDDSVLLVSESGCGMASRSVELGPVTDELLRKDRPMLCLPVGAWRGEIESFLA